MNTPPEPPSETISKSSPSTNPNVNKCQVCGDTATIINYGALSCLSCRTFFRRNAYNPNETVTCRFDGQCEINILSRKICTACRLAKCLSVGMTPELIRKEDLSGRKRKSISEENLNESTVMKMPSRTTTAELRSTSSSPIKENERTRILNICHAFDTFCPIGEIRRRIDLTMKTFDHDESLEILSIFYHSIRSFISSTPDFQILTIGEQTSLFQRNMTGLFALGTLYLTRECDLFRRDDGLPFFASESFQRAKSISEQLDSDPTVMKLLLVALAFSSNCSIMHKPTNIEQDSLLFGTFRLFGSQNVYAELIWKYLIQSYGLQESIQRFSKLIQSLLDVLQLANEIYARNSTFQQFLHERLEQNDSTSNKPNDSSSIPLWGKH